MVYVSGSSCTIAFVTVLQNALTCLFYCAQRYSCFSVWTFPANRICISDINFSSDLLSYMRRCVRSCANRYTGVCVCAHTSVGTCICIRTSEHLCVTVLCPVLQLHIPLRLLCGGLLFTCNAVMWTFFAKALRYSSSSARATVTTTASNFISSVSILHVWLCVYLWLHQTQPIRRNEMSWCMHLR